MAIMTVMTAIAVTIAISVTVAIAVSITGNSHFCTSSVTYPIRSTPVSAIFSTPLRILSMRAAVLTDYHNRTICHTCNCGCIRKHSTWRCIYNYVIIIFTEVPLTAAQDIRFRSAFGWMFLQLLYPAGCPAHTRRSGAIASLSSASFFSTSAMPASFCP